MPITEIHGRLIETPTYPYLLLSARLRRPALLSPEALLYLFCIDGYGACRKYSLASDVQDGSNHKHPFFF